MASDQSTFNYPEYCQHSNYQFPLDAYSTATTGKAVTGTQHYGYNGHSGYGSNNGYTEQQYSGTYGPPSSYNYGSYYGYQAPSGSTAPSTVASTSTQPPSQSVTWPAPSITSAKEIASSASTLTSPPAPSAQGNSIWSGYGYGSQYGSYGDQSSNYQTSSSNQQSQYGGYNQSSSYIQPTGGSSQSARGYSKLAGGSAQPAGAYGTQAAQTSASFSGQNQLAVVYGQQSGEAEQLMRDDYSSMCSQPSQDSYQQASCYRQQPASKLGGYGQESSTYWQLPVSKLGGYGQESSTYGQQPVSKPGGYGQESITYGQQPVSEPGGYGQKSGPYGQEPRSGECNDQSVGYGESSSAFGQEYRQEGGCISQQSSGHSPQSSGYNTQSSGYIQRTNVYSGSCDYSKVKSNRDDLLNPWKQKSFEGDKYQNNIGGSADRMKVSVGSSQQRHDTGKFDRSSDTYQGGFGADKGGFDDNRGSLRGNKDEEQSLDKLCANNYSYNGISRREGNMINRGGGQNTRGELSNDLLGGENENNTGGFGKCIGLSRGQTVQDETLYSDKNGQQSLASGRYGQDMGGDRRFGEDDGRGLASDIGRGFVADSERGISGDRSRSLDGNRGWCLDDKGKGIERGRALGQGDDDKIGVVNINVNNLPSGIAKSTISTRGPDRGNKDDRDGRVSNVGSALANSAPAGIADPTVLDIASETSDMPWTNTTSKLNDVLKRKSVPILESNEAKKKKEEEEKIDVMPFIKAHVIENCTFNPDARKLAEEALKKMMQPAYCVLCNARITGRQQALLHYQGKTHCNKIKNFITCCMTKYAENVKEYEIKTEEQKLNEWQEEEKRNKPLDQKIAEARVPLDGHNPDMCRLCCMVFSSPLQANEHYSGKHHQKRLRQLNDPQKQEGFGCQMCNVYVTSLEMLNLHYQGSKHKARVERDRNYKKSDASKVVPLGGLMVDRGRSLRPGEVVPEGFIVKPYHEPTRNEAFTSQFEGPDGFFSNDPVPIQIGPTFENDEESRSSRRRKHKQKHGHNFYSII